MRVQPVQQTGCVRMAAAFTHRVWRASSCPFAGLEKRFPNCCIVTPYHREVGGQQALSERPWYLVTRTPWPVYAQQRGHTRQKGCVV